MAKGKHAAALFEVINKGGSHPPVSGRRGLFKLFKRRRSGGESLGAVAPMRASAIADAAPEPSISSMSPGSLSGALSADDGGTRRRPRAFYLGVDPQRRLLTLRLSFASAVIAGFGLCAALGMVYLLGRQTTTPPSLLLAQRTSEVARQQPPQRTVLDVGGRRPVVDVDVSDNVSQLTSRAVSLTSGGTSTQQWNDPRPPATHVVADSNRRVGLNYVIVQSYREEKMAKDACDFLRANGVEATVEKGPPGWASAAWYSVVGIDGFSRISMSPEYERYVGRIKALNEKWSPKRESFKSFDPKAYRWGKSGN